ncbi:prepilin-type N-terminal cleavage/methylation domain-containing protein [Microbacterium sp. 179-I 1D1 NHS]|uniref:prepilin-type N-terminal cleavage/methylation domain-containing protein n=1 Tax=Microbacterium sp. 179-I 1D1 NHS TaxID=3374298 RepID=UPI003879BC37
MRASLKNYIAACNRRKEETGESGFSLIELIVVVVILGILAAIAVPVFTGLQAQADTSAVKTVAANGATQVASDIAQAAGTPPTVAELNTNLDKLENEGITVAVALTGGGTVPSIGNYCVTAKKTGVDDQTSGPGC